MLTEEKKPAVEEETVDLEEFLVEQWCKMIFGPTYQLSTRPEKEKGVTDSHAS